MNAAERIKEALTMREVAETYGFPVNRAGFISCPIHDEKTPSLKLYPDDRGFYCFGCGVGGDVINFVEHVFRINFPQAVARIGNDFGLDVTDRKPGLGEMQRFMARQEERKRREAREIELFDNECRLAAEINQAEITMQEHKPFLRDGEPVFPDEWAEAVRRLDKLRMELYENDREQERFKKEAVNHVSENRNSGVHRRGLPGEHRTL